MMAPTTRTRWRTLLIGALSSCAVLTISGCGDDDHATGPPPSERGRIAYVSLQSGNADIFLMDGDGGNKLNITANSTFNESSPAWSPDGTRIAFVSDRDGDAEIYVMTEHGRDQTNLTHAPGSSEWHPTWNPDGRKIAFLSNRSGNWDVFIMDADGRNVRNLTNNSIWVADTDPAWDPLDHGIAVTSDTEGWQDIYLVDTNTGERTPLTYHQASNCAPAWSADGSKILFSRIMGGLCPEIWLMDRDGSNQRRIIDLSCAHGGQPSWSPNGVWISYTSGSGPDTYEIYRADADGQNRVNLTNSPGWDGDSAWRP